MNQEHAMFEQPKRLSQLPDLQESVKLDRNLLKDMAAEVLREHISGGLIPEGTKITEREVSRMLGISRMPARDALMTLEAEGLVERRSDGRYVIELTEDDVRAMYQVRTALEKLAAGLAAANIDEKDRAALRAKLRDLEEAVATGDPGLCTKRDVALHREIWHQADNLCLLRILDSVVGVIFVIADRVNVYGRDDPRHSEQLLSEHRQLADLVAAGDGTGAGRAMEAHLKSALKDSLRTLRTSERANDTVSQRSRTATLPE
jgi:DNA-binding GntR family transcriptional regulator